MFPIIPDFLTFPEWGQHITLALYAILGLALCFWGHRLVPVWIGVVGFAAGAALGLFVLSLTTLTEPVYRVVVVAALAVLLCVVCLKVFKIGVFVLAAYCTYNLALVLVRDAPVGNVDPRYIALAAAVIAGALAIIFLKTIIVITTSLGGGMAAGYGIMTLALVTQRTAYLVLGVVFAIFGLIWQFALVPSRPRGRGR